MLHILPLVLFYKIFFEGPSYVNLDQNAYDLWSEIGLDTQVVKERVINDKQCNQNKPAVVHCIYAFNKLLETLPEQKLLLPPIDIDKHEKNFFGISKTLTKTEQYTLVQLNNQDIDSESIILSDFLRSQNKTQIEAISSWIQFLKNNDQYIFNSNELLNNIVKDSKKFLRTLEKDNAEINSDEQIEAFISVTLLNGYMQAKYGDNSGIANKLEFDQQMESKGSIFEGIGAELFLVEKGILISRILEGGSAEENGLLTGDIITHVNGEDVIGRSLVEVIDEIKGEAGTTVDITFVREKEILTKTLPRKKIKLENVQYSILNSSQGKIGYIKLISFLNNYADVEMAHAIEEFDKQKVKILILDLRNNGGGLVDQAINVADLFLDKGKIVYSAHFLNSNVVEVFRTKKSAKTKLPLIVLQNSNSASASELVSGALRDHKRALVVGARSYGKGTIQSVEPSNILSYMYLSKNVARFHQPNGSSNHIYGILPHIEIQPLEPEKFMRAIYRIEDISVFPISSVQNKQVPTVSPELLNCYNNKGSAEVDFKNNSIQRSYDYELLKAKDIAKCVLVNQ